jgi:hypothetical protein
MIVELVSNGKLSGTTLQVGGKEVKVTSVVLVGTLERLEVHAGPETAAAAVKERAQKFPRGRKPKLATVKPPAAPGPTIHTGGSPADKED